MASAPSVDSSLAALHPAGDTVTAVLAEPALSPSIGAHERYRADYGFGGR
jgi:hypothetical protein